MFPKLYLASKQTTNLWVFELEYPGRSRRFYGIIGDPFEQPVIIGKSYILKLIHQVDDKIQGRSRGHSALVTQQPLTRASLVTSLLKLVEVKCEIKRLKIRGVKLKSDVFLSFSEMRI